MKRLFIILSAGLLILSCEQKNKTTYSINGNAKDVYNGIRVYLKQTNAKGERINKDTAIVFNEAFKMEGKITDPTLYVLSVDGSPGEAVFMLENSEIDIEINKANVAESKILGSESNKGFKAFQDDVLAIKERGEEAMIAYRQAQLADDDTKIDSISQALDQIRQLMLEHPLNFVKQNPDLHFSLNLIELESTKPKFDVVKFTEAFNNLTPHLKSSEKGQDVRKRLNELYIVFETTAHLEIGKTAPNFEAPKPNGDLVSLNELRGDVTIIDFWAAWCGPCRKENPNMVRLYNQYHSQGLEIIGVSLDGQGRQKDPKKAWIEAIEKDKLTWTQVSNLNYFNDPVAKLYNINSIPATYILNSEGIIVAKNLRGRALENKIAVLLKK